MSDSERPNPPPAFDAGFRARLLDLIQWRRDVRHFRRDPLDQTALDRLVETACRAPSVGLSEPWRFVMVTEPARRRAIRECFVDCNADALNAQSTDRASDYARLKLAGLDAAPGHVAVFADRSTLQGHGLGRRTMPETIEYSVVMAIHTLWLAARAEESASAGSRSWNLRGCARSSTCRRIGRSSVIYVSGIRSKTTTRRSWNVKGGSSGTTPALQSSGDSESLDLPARSRNNRCLKFRFSGAIQS